MMNGVLCLWLLLGPMDDAPGALLLEWQAVGMNGNGHRIMATAIELWQRPSTAIYRDVVDSNCHCCVESTVNTCQPKPCVDAGL